MSISQLLHSPATDVVSMFVHPIVYCKSVQGLKFASEGQPGLVVYL